jgi:uncharacterized membrane protein YbjE (DUF340 family)
MEVIMWSIAVTVSLGIIIGLFLKWTDRMKELNGKFQLVFLSLLLFLMGVSIGSNPQIVENLSLIGLKSLMFSIMTVAFSVLFIYIATLFIRRDAK